MDPSAIAAKTLGSTPLTLGPKRSLVKAKRNSELRQNSTTRHWIATTIYNADLCVYGTTTPYAPNPYPWSGCTSVAFGLIS